MKSLKRTWGISNPLEFWKLFEKCISIDDVQVLEDIFAVSFGIALDQFICDEYLLIASKWFVENLFSKEKIERWMQNTDIPQFDKWISNTNGEVLLYTATDVQNNLSGITEFYIVNVVKMFD